MSFSIPEIVDRETHVILEPCPKRIRVAFGGKFVADSTEVRLLFERGHPPVYYFPRDDVSEDVLVESEKTYHCPRKGDAQYWSIETGGRRADDAVWNYPDPKEACPPIGELVAFEWDAVDAWLEEDEEVFVHARSPYTRIDVLESSRHIEVQIGVETIAESERPVLLFETGLPVRYYLPKPDVRSDVLFDSDTVTRCPYKGVANRYWSVEAGGKKVTDAAWSYDYPTAEVTGSAGRIAFFSERLSVIVDGRPVQ